MAIIYKHLKAEIENTPLSAKEILMIDLVEQYIDNQILEKFDKNPYGEVSIDICYPKFTYCPATQLPIKNLGVSRIPKMKAELERRYKEAGWDIKYDYSDGTSMCSADYMVLKGRK